MFRFYKTLFIVLSIFILMWLLPWLFNLFMVSRSSAPFTLYSEIIGDFAMLQTGEVNEKGKPKINYTDRRGNNYTEAQFDSILPTFYYRQLVTDNRLPDTILGQHVTAQTIKKGNFIFRSRPSEINARFAPLYPLLESRSKRVDLEMPDDVFRFSKRGIEFIDMETNSVNKEKSMLFQNVFEQKNVVLPAKHIAGNPTNRKEYDEGYFFVDAQNRLFHLKQMQGRPFLRLVEMDANVEISHIFVTEYPSRRYFAFLTDVEHNFYVLTAPDYRLQKVAIPPFDARKDEITIFGNMFNWTVKQSADSDEQYTAIDAHTLTTIDTMSIAKPERSSTQIAAYLFPVQLRFTDSSDRYFMPRVKNVSPLALPLNILCLALFLLFFRKGNYRTELILKSVAVTFFGVFALVPLMLVRD